MRLALVKNIPFNYMTLWGHNRFDIIRGVDWSGALLQWGLWESIGVCYYWLLSYGIHDNPCSLLQDVAILYQVEKWPKILSEILTRVLRWVTVTSPCWGKCCDRYNLVFTVNFASFIPQASVIYMYMVGWMVLWLPFYWKAHCYPCMYFIFQKKYYVGAICYFNEH